MTKQNKGRKLFAVSASAALVASAIVPVASAASVEDLKDKGQISGYALPFVTALVEADVMQGKAGGNFDPKGNLTRAEAAVMFTKAFGLEAKGKNSFKDLKAGAWYEDFVLAVADNDIVVGFQDGTFGPNNNITRAQAAVMIVKALGEEAVTNADLSKFEDASSVPAWAKGFIAKAVDLGIITGRQAGDKLYLDYSKAITRQDFAVMFQKTGVEAGLWDAIGGSEEVSLEALEAAQAAVEAFETVNAENKAKAQAAVDALNKEIAALEALNSSDEEVVAAIAAAKEVAAAAQAKIDAVNVELTVESVSAINGTSLKVTGEGLAELKAEDFTVAGTTVKTVTPAEDGKSATLELSGALAPNKDTKVTYGKGEAAQEFTVNFKFEPKSVKVLDGTYDDDTANQFVTVEIDGAIIPTTYLHTAGYTVEFKAYNATTGVDETALLFANTSTGELNAFKVAGKYNVQVVVSQGSTILTSQYASIEVRNLDNASTTTESYRIVTDAGVIVSDTLVRGENASFATLFVGNGDTIVDVIAAGADYEVTSSNPAVISVNSDNELTAVGLGSATITAKVGNATKTVTLNVKGEARTATTVTADNALTSVIGGNNNFTVTVLDQYGNRVANPSTQVNVTYPTNVSLTTATATDGARVGTLNLTLVGDVAGQSGAIVFKHAVTGALLGTSTVKVTNVNNVVKSLLETNAADTTINPNNELDDEIVYTLEKYTSENVWNGTYSASELAGYTVKFNGRIIEVNGQANNDANATFTFNGEDELVITGKQAGTTTVSLYNTVGQLVDTKSITVNSSTAALTGVNWSTTSNIVAKAIDVNYETVLPVTKSTTVVSDDVINASALKLSSPIVNKARIGQYDVQDDTTKAIRTSLPALPIDSVENVIYVDKNDDGRYQSGETILGFLTAVASTDATFAVTNPVNDAFNGFPTADGSKGKLVFNVVNPLGNTVASKEVTINVPMSAQQQIAASVKTFGEKYADIASGSYVDAYVTAAAAAYNNLPAAVKAAIASPSTADENAAATALAALQGEVVSRFIDDATRGTNKPTKAHYAALDVTGVTDTNVAKVTAAVDALAGGFTATDIQPLVNKVNTVAKVTKSAAFSNASKTLTVTAKYPTFALAAGQADNDAATLVVNSTVTIPASIVADITAGTFGGITVAYNGGTANSISDTTLATALSAGTTNADGSVTIQGSALTGVSTNTITDVTGLTETFVITATKALTGVTVNNTVVESSFDYVSGK